jgi:hypothetical protein
MVFLLEIQKRTGLLLAAGEIALLKEGSHVDFRNTVLGLPLLTTDLPLRQQPAPLTAMCSVIASLRAAVSDDLLIGIPAIQDEA